MLIFSLILIYGPINVKCHLTFGGRNGKVEGRKNFVTITYKIKISKICTEEAPKKIKVNIIDERLPLKAWKLVINF